MRKITDPCYTSNDCESHYNIDPILMKPSKDYGLDPEYCSGILESCDPNTVNCREGTFDPALNTANNPMGCIFGSSGCKEFQRTEDTVAKCKCWELGGRSIVDDKCKTLGSSELCGLADYFCAWDGIKCNSVTEEPTPNVSKIHIVGNPNCAKGDPTCRKFSGNAVVNCSRSNTDPTASDSLNPKAWTCKIEWEYPGKPSEELTIRNPMCQYVPDSTMCTFRTEGTKDNFMCSRIIAAKLNEGGQYDSKYLLNGFCTWCQGQSNTPEELGFIPVAREYRFQTEWKFGKNRCGDYNKCEVEDSEKLYNQCVWEESAGKLGIDPKTLSSMSESETKTLFLTKGFCYDGDDPVHSKIVSTCDKKLLGPTVSAENTYVPDKTAYWPKGTSMGNWVHECNNGLSNNYYCTWCPSLRGSVTQRSLEVIIGSAVGSAVGSATISCAVVGILIATKVIAVFPKGAMIGISVGSVLVGVIVGILLWLV